VFVLKTGIQWEYLPQEMGCGSEIDLLAPPAGPAAPGAPAHGGAGRIDWSRASADAARVPAKGGGRPVRARDTVRQRAAIGRR
jgi:hypothetical protein